ncbi:MAG: CinA family nicotinamide mononucleotide deamidase-related protein [Anaerolineae bacterium]
MRAEVISVGTELLLGEILDTNAQYIARELREIGLDLIYRTTVGDNEERIAAVVDTALSRVSVVITTGGLGPTVDDVTREGIARATGRKLVFSPMLYDQIAERFRRLGVQMSENNRRQAFIPEGAIPVENPVGTAPIFILETNRGVVITLPGVPREMKYLMEHSVIPWLKHHLDTPAVIKARLLKVAGMGESLIDEKIGDLMTMSNPTVGLAAHAGQVDIRITAKAATVEEALAMIEPVEREIRARLGDWIFGVDDDRLEDVLLTLLIERGQTLTSVEVGSESLLTERLERARQAAPAAFHATLRAASPGDLAELEIDTGSPIGRLAEDAAQAIRARTGADYGVAVISGVDAAGDQMAVIAIASARGCRSREYPWLARRSDAALWVASHALAMARREVLKAE